MKSCDEPLPCDPPAGFWNRVSAAVIDILLLYVLMRLVETALIQANIYIPFEAAYVCTGVIYAILTLGLGRTTAGKALCGLHVRTVSGERIRLARAAARETVGKFISVLPLGAGFVAAAGPAKRGWHDRMAGTVVVRSSKAQRRRRAGTTAGFAAGMLILIVWTTGAIRLYVHVLPMAPASDRPRSVGRDREELIEAALIADLPDQRFATWLDAQADEASAFVTEKCREYPLVIVGERHWQREPLVFLRDILPRLYHECGVTCIAMEWLLASDNGLLDQLLRNNNYDERLAIEISRHNSWKTWGWQEYMDVLHAAWRLNRVLGSAEPKMRIVGLDLPIDLPALALAGLSDDAVEAPFWERLRVVRVAPELPKIFLRDAFMARQVELQVLERAERGLVWVGAAHSIVNSPGPGSAGTGWGRMGFMLHQKYPGEVFQIVLHGAFAGVDPYGNPTAIDQFIDRVMEKRGNEPVGFETLGSPFDRIRDSPAWPFRTASEMSLGDLACGYLFLGPSTEVTRCRWIDGYVTEAMFTANRPFYAAKGREVGVDVHNVVDAELALKRQ